MKGIRFLQTIQVKLIIIYVLLILIAMQLIGIYFVRTVESTFVGTFSSSLNSQAYLLAEYVKTYLSAGQSSKNGEAKKTYDDLNFVVNNLFSIKDAEIQIIDASGKVISTSLQTNQSIVGNKNTQIEVSRALQGIKNESELLDSDNKRKKVIAMPVRGEGKIIGAVFIEASMEEMFDTMNRVNRIFITGTMFALALTALLGVILSNTITTPIKEITRKATEIAEGNYSQQVKVLGNDEIGQLGRAFNYMTDRLKEALLLNEEEKEKLASILSNMSDGVIATDETGRVIVYNRPAKQMLRVQNESMIGHEISSLLGMTKDQIERYTESDDNTAVLLDIGLGEQEERLTVRVTFNPIHRRGMGVTGVIAVLQDVTEQEKLEQSRKEFVANVSHELRTPLTTIKSYLEALDDGALEDPQLSQRFIGVTRNETERMIRLVNDLLQLSRLDSRQAVLTKEATDIAQMLEDVADRFSFQLQQKSIDVSIQVENGLPHVMLDQDQIDQVLDNLVSNAIKYTGEGGFIQVNAYKKDRDWLEISVKDNGIGIPKKDQGRIFDRFYRVDKARSRSMGGTGLGLSIAREIIKAHGGTIMLESEANQGTKITFALPLKADGGDRP